MKIFIVLVLAIASVSDGSVLPQQQFIERRKLPMASNMEGRITNGLNATDGQFPYQAVMEFTNVIQSVICGGVLIGPTWSATACHCTFGALFGKISLGGTVRTNPEISITVSRLNIVQHPECGYPLSLGNDLSLIKHQRVEFTSKINKIALPPLNSFDKYVGREVVASGYGYTSDSATTVSPTLQYASFKVISNEDCEKYYDGPSDVTAGTLCIETYNGTSICRGDSGGPLALPTPGEQEFVLVGITSFGSLEGCQVGAPGGFTRISEYTGWINDKTGISY